MSVVAAKTREDFTMFLKFMKDRGVVLPASSDLQFIGRMNDEGKMLGAVAFNGFLGATCCMHVAGDGNWLSRRLLNAVFDYAFNRCKMECVIGPVAANNSRALAFDHHVGFTMIHTIVNGWEPGVDLVVMQMLRKDCRWIQETEDGKQELDARPA